MASPVSMHTANMKHNYRLVAIDMDGTLLRRDKTIGTQTAMAVNTALEQGTEVVIATGRSRVQSERYMDTFPQMRYVITSSGAVVYDMKAGWKKIISIEIPAEIVQEILQYADTLDCFPIMSVGGKTVYTAHLAPEAAAYGLGAYVYEINTFGTGVESVSEWYRCNRQPVESVSLYFRDPKLRHRTVDSLKHLPLYFALPGEPAVEIGMDTANKGDALTALCERLGVELADTMAIGDSDNDIPMLEIVGCSVASGNAPDEVKAKVDYITADCDHDGVALALKQYIIE